MQQNERSVSFVVPILLIVKQTARYFYFFCPCDPKSPASRVGLHPVHEVCQKGRRYQIGPDDLQEGPRGPAVAPPRLRFGRSDGVLLQQGSSPKGLSPHCSPRTCFAVIWHVTLLLPFWRQFQLQRWFKCSGGKRPDWFENEPWGKCLIGHASSVALYSPNQTHSVLLSNVYFKNVIQGLVGHYDII